MLTLAALLLLPMAGRPAPRSLGPDLPWLLLASLFYVVEARVIHLHIGRSAHSFSMSEIPLVVGMFFFGPLSMASARVVGGGLALLLARRQRSVKLAFNASLFLLGAAIASAVVQLLGPGSTFGPVEWACAYVVVLLENIVSVSAIAMVISLSEGRWQLRRIPEMLRAGLLVALTNTSLALLLVVVAKVEPSAVLLFGVPVVVVAVAYTAYVRQVQQNEGLQMLYESARILQRGPQVEQSVTELLDHAARMFRAEVAELHLLPAHDGEPLLVSTVTGGIPERVMEPAGMTLDDPLLRRALDERRPLLVGSTDPATGPRFRNALVAPLADEHHILGLLTIANRLSEISTFDQTDLRLFETLASHVAVSLENGQLVEAIHRLAELRDELNHQANTDTLTGLGNRARFTQAVAARLGVGDFGGRVLALLFIDLDDFKLVNDSLGHNAGDNLLRQVGSRIAALVREDDIAVRLGGDEFAILLWDREDLSGIRQLADRLTAALVAPFRLGDASVTVPASMGIAWSSSGSISAEDLMRDADVAMYSAKANGKHQVAVFRPSMAEQLTHQARTVAELRDAIRERQLVLYYQPVFDITRERIVGCEALMRWQHPTRGLVGPAEFISLAEQSSLILDLGDFALREAVAQLHRWAEAGPPYSSWWLSVNVSPRQLQQTSFLPSIAELIKTGEIAPGQLAIELVESALMPQADYAAASLRALSDLGVRLLIDDFGTGYSSLSYLSRLPVDTLKIAREFIDVERGEPYDWGLATAIIAMARTLGLDVIAEGVESEWQLRRLRQLGCDLAQGYLLARPMPAAALAQVVADERARHEATEPAARIAEQIALAVERLEFGSGVVAPEPTGLCAEATFGTTGGRPVPGRARTVYPQQLAGTPQSNWPV